MALALRNMISSSISGKIFEDEEEWGI